VTVTLMAERTRGSKRHKQAKRHGALLDEGSPSQMAEKGCEKEQHDAYPHNSGDGKHTESDISATECPKPRVNLT
jgi:hypothetical protein